MRDADFGEQAPTAGLGPEREELRVSAVQRNTEPQREVALQQRDVVGDQVGSVGIEDERADPLEEVQALQQLEGERSGAAVLGCDGEEPSARVARNHAG